MDRDRDELATLIGLIRAGHRPCEWDVPLTEAEVGVLAAMLLLDGFEKTTRLWFVSLAQAHQVGEC